MENEGECFFCIIDQKIPNQNGKNPRDRSERSGLRSIACPLCEKSRIQHIWSAQKQDQEQKAEISSQHLHPAKKGKEVNRGIQKKPIPLVKEIANKCFPSDPKWNIEYDGFEV